MTYWQALTRVYELAIAGLRGPVIDEDLDALLFIRQLIETQKDKDVGAPRGATK